jgi:hypothetical protein
MYPTHVVKLLKNVRVCVENFNSIAMVVKIKKKYVIYRASLALDLSEKTPCQRGLSK